MKEPNHSFRIPLSPPLRWALAAAAAVVTGVLWAYYWRVFFYLDSRVSPLVPTHGCTAICLGVVAAAALLRRLRTLPAKGAVCLLLCGLLFCFANPPLQTPDESEHYLRTYAISTGHLDFDYERSYPDDVAALLSAFPGAWTNSHTSVGVGNDPDTGEEKLYDSAGYALKQYGDDGRIESVADSFADYFANRDTPAEEPLHEPVSFLILPKTKASISKTRISKVIFIWSINIFFALNIIAYYFINDKSIF